LDLDHYQFTDYKREKVTLGLKTVLTRIPGLLSLLPLDLQRHFKNEKTSKLVPDHWWRRSDSETSGDEGRPLERRSYMPPVTRTSFDAFIKQNTLAPYNKNPQAEVHPLGRLPVVSITLFTVTASMAWNLVKRRKVGVVNADEERMSEYLELKRKIKEKRDREHMMPEPPEENEVIPEEETP